MLETMDHPHVVRFVDSNTSQFQEDVALYLVTEYVPGPSLRDFCEQAPSCQVSAAIILNVLETLRVCHNQDLVHRDIKPEHVILRDRDVTCPVLIDFGIAFKDELADGETDIQQGVGNRFIILPEQQAGSLERQDPRSDITQLVGLLFFLLTGQAPHVITDQRGLTAC